MASSGIWAFYRKPTAITNSALRMCLRKTTHLSFPWHGLPSFATFSLYILLRAYIPAPQSTFGQNGSGGCLHLEACTWACLRSMLQAHTVFSNTLSSQKEYGTPKAASTASLLLLFASASATVSPTVSRLPFPPSSFLLIPAEQPALFSTVVRPSPLIL